MQRFVGKLRFVISDHTRTPEMLSSLYLSAEYMIWPVSDASVYRHTSSKIASTYEAVTSLLILANRLPHIFLRIPHTRSTVDKRYKKWDTRYKMWDPQRTYQGSTLNYMAEEMLVTDYDLYKNL